MDYLPFLGKIADVNKAINNTTIHSVLKNILTEDLVGLAKIILYCVCTRV